MDINNSTENFKKFISKKQKKESLRDQAIAYIISFLLFFLQIYIIFWAIKVIDPYVNISLKNFGYLETAILYMSFNIIMNKISDAFNK